VENTVTHTTEITPDGTAADYQRLRTTIGVYRRSRGLIRLAGLERGELVRFLMARDTEYTEPLTCMDSLVLNEDGTPLDLVTLFEMDNESWLAADSLAGAELAGLAEAATSDLELSDITVTDVSDTHEIVAFEGPESWRVAATLIDFDIAGLVLNAVTEVTLPGGEQALLARTGSTGEYGYVIVAERAADAHATVMEHAKEHGGGSVGEFALVRAQAEVRHPCLPSQAEGLAVREAGLEWLVGLTRTDGFRGGEALADAEDPSYGLVAAVAETDGLCRGDLVRTEQESVGHVQVVLPNADTGDTLALLALARPFDVPGLVLIADGADEATVMLHTVSSPSVIPQSWTKGLGE